MMRTLRVGLSRVDPFLLARNRCSEAHRTQRPPTKRRPSRTGVGVHVVRYWVAREAKRAGPAPSAHCGQRGHSGGQWRAAGDHPS